MGYIEVTPGTKAVVASVARVHFCAGWAHYPRGGGHQMMGGGGSVYIGMTFL